MTLPAELRAEADRPYAPGINAYYHDEPTRALLHRAADALEWRPIESAPRDGTEILAYGLEPARWGYSDDILRAEFIRWDRSKSRFRKSRGCGGPDEFNPTHWRPLDAPLPATPEGV